MTRASVRRPRPLIVGRVRAHSSLRGHRWFAACALGVLLASDYKFRVRDPGSTERSVVDVAILVELAVYGVVAVYLLGVNPHRLRVRRLPAPMLMACALLVVMVLAIPRAANLEVQLVRGFEMLVVTAVAMRLWRRGGQRDVHVFLHAFLLVVAASVVFGVVHPMPRFDSQLDRFTWLRIHPVTSAVYSGVAVIIAAAYLVGYSRGWDGPRWPRWAYALTGLIVAAGLYASKTRGAVLGVVVGLLVLGWLLTKGRRRVELLAGLVVASAAFGLVAQSQIVAYVRRGESAQQFASLNSRTGLWDIAWQFIGQQPLYGYGLGASHTLFLDSTGLGGAHNAVVNVLVDLGVVGALVWGALIVTTVATALRAPTVDAATRLGRALLVAIMAMLLVNGISNGGLGDEANIASTMLFFLAAWASLLARDANGTRRLHSPDNPIAARHSSA